MIDFSNISLGYMATLITSGIIGFILIIIFIRPGLFVSKVFFAILKKSPTFVILLALITMLLLTFSFLNPWYFPLTVILIFIGGVKIYEWIDNSFLSYKIGNWFDEQKSVYIKVIPAENSNITVDNMEKFFLMMSGIHGARSEKAFRTKGTYFEQFTMEFISDGGKVNMYIKIWKQSLGTLTSGLKLYFPLVQFQEVENPLENMPKDLSELKKEYEHTDFGEFSGIGSDIYPTKYFEELGNLKSDYKQTPIKQLIECFEAVEDGDMAILQFNFRPQDTSKTGAKKDWEKELTKVRKALATNASVSLGANGVVNHFTPTEVKIIESIERKIPSTCYETKIRFGLLGKKITGKRYLGNIMAYWKNYATPNQVIIPSPKSWDESPSATWGQFWDKLYWEPEIFKRQTQMYNAILSRSLSMVGKIRYWDIAALSSVLQIPNTYLDRQIIQNSQIAILVQPITQPQPDEEVSVLIESNETTPTIQPKQELEIPITSNSNTNKTSDLPISNISIENAIPLAKPMSSNSASTEHYPKTIKSDLSDDYSNFSQSINQTTIQPKNEQKYPFVDNQKAIPMPQRLEDEEEFFTSVGE